uniref:hypothetical protein n=1 Tax=Synechococcus sp. UW106 TaxID=368495 RepID=UPI000E0E2B93|nr:hypothetical protein [Synechococcus sp. UW106]
MTFLKARRIVVLSGLIILFWIWIDPAFAVVLGIISIAVLSVANLHPKPRWLQKFWAYCIDLGQHDRELP